MPFCGQLLGRRMPPTWIAPPFSKPPTPPSSTQDKVVVPLTGVKTSSKIVDFVAQVEILQRYTNTENDPIEAVYEFPLEGNASVTNFFAQIDEDKIEGKLQEKNKARDTYDNAISSGHGAYLMEESEEKKNLFSVNVGNLPPNKEIIIGITYVMELAFDKEKLKFSLPVQSQRNSNNNEPRFVKGSSDKKSPVEFGLNCKIDLQFSNSNIKTIESPSHPIEFEFGDSLKEASVTLKVDSSQPLTKSFELLVTLKNPHTTCALVEKSVKHKDSKAAMFCVYPELDEDKDDVNAEIIFLVDRSGSMGIENRINSVKETLQVFLRSLPESIKFNIHGFGSKFEQLFPESQVFSDTSLQKATEHVSRLNANLGGTDILTPLKKIFATKCEGGIPRQIFLLTDGEVSNTKDIVTEVRKNAGSTKVFTFGMGSGADRALVQGVADAGNGSASFIRYGDNVDGIVLKVLEKVLKPTLTDLKLELSDKSLEISPAFLAPQFAGQSILFYAFLKKDVESVGITLTGSCGKKKFEFQAEAKVSSGREGDLLHSLAARSFIKDMESEKSHFHQENGALKSGVSQDKVEKAILDLSLQHHILCKATAFVAVEKRKEATEGSMQMRSIAFEDLKEKESQHQRQQKQLLQPQTSFSSRSSSIQSMPPMPPSAPFGGAAPRGPPQMNIGAAPSRGPPQMNRGAAPSRGLPQMNIGAAPSRGPPPMKADMMSRGPSLQRSFASAPMPPPVPMAAMALSDLNQDTNSFNFAPSASSERSSSLLSAISTGAKLKKKTSSEKRSRDSSASRRLSVENECAFDDQLDSFASLSLPVEESMPTKRNEAPAPVSSSMDQNQVRNLLLQVSANGSFKPEALKLIGKSISMEEIEAVPHNKEIVITAIIIAFLEGSCQQHKSTWNLIVKKARKFVGDENVIRIVKEKFSL